MRSNKLKENRTVKAILTNMLLAAVSLFANGFGVYLTIQANIGAGPWDVLNLGLSKSLGILYGTASVAVSYAILGIDIALKGPIGIAMFIDAFVVGKSVDFFNRINLVPKCNSLITVHSLPARSSNDFAHSFQFAYGEECAHYCIMFLRSQRRSASCYL